MISYKLLIVIVEVGHLHVLLSTDHVHDHTMAHDVVHMQLI